MESNGALITAAFALAWALSATTAIPSGPAATGFRVVAVTVSALLMIAAVVFAADRAPITPPVPACPSSGSAAPTCSGQSSAWASRSWC